MIYAKKTENPEGDYVDAAADRWDFSACDRVVSRRPPEELGYTTFESREDALAAWGLTYDPLPAPEPEPQAACECPVP